MRVFIIGANGAVGGLLADKLKQGGATVGGIVRRRETQMNLWDRGVRATVADLATMSSNDLAALLRGYDAVVYAAGSNGGARAVTDAIDGAGVTKALAGARRAGVDRFLLVSVFPESWRERDNGHEVEHYFAVKKEADVAVTVSGLNWLIVRHPCFMTGHRREWSPSVPPRFTNLSLAATLPRRSWRCSTIR